MIATSIMKWFRVNLLLKILKKTKYTIFTFKKELMLLHDIVLNDVISQHVNSIKFLGCFIDSTLSWHELINYVIAQNRKIITLLK